MEKRGPTGGGSSGHTNLNNTRHKPITSAADKECMVREQYIFMPIANVLRLMRRTLPYKAKISIDGKETIQECVSEFISFVTSEANMRCQRERRKTITAEDVLWAMNNLGFDDYIEPLTIYLNRFREIESGEWNPLPVRMSIEHGAMGVAVATGFTPTYYIGPHIGIPGVMTPEGFLKDAQNAGGTSGARVSSLDP